MNVKLAGLMPQYDKKHDEEAKMDKSSPLERYVRILEVLASFPSGVSVVDIASILRLPRPTAHRLLKVMQQSQIVEQRASNRFTVGRRIQRLLLLSADMKWMDTLIRPQLHDLAEELGETCYLGKLDTTRIVSVMMESPKSSWRGFVVQGRNFPPHAAAGAKAILAFQPGEVAERILGTEHPQMTRFTKVSLPQILAEYETIRANGFAVCKGEIEEELVGIAVPIQIPEIGVTYSLGTTAPNSRLSSENFEAVVAILRPVADRIGLTIGKGLSNATE